MDLLVVNNEWGSTSEITGMNMTNEVYVMHLCSVTASQMQIPLWDKELDT